MYYGAMIDAHKRRIRWHFVKVSFRGPTNWRIPNGTTGHNADTLPGSAHIGIAKIITVMSERNESNKKPVDIQKAFRSSYSHSFVFSPRAVFRVWGPVAYCNFGDSGRPTFGSSGTERSATAVQVSCSDYRLKVTYFLDNWYWNNLKPTILPHEAMLARYMLSSRVCPSVVYRSGVLQRLVNLGLHKQRHAIAQGL